MIFPPEKNATQSVACTVLLFTLPALFCFCRDALAADTGMYYPWVDHSLAEIARQVELLAGQQYAGLLSAYPFFISTMTLHLGWFFWPMLFLSAWLLFALAVRHYPDHRIVPQLSFYWLVLTAVLCVSLVSLPYVVAILFSESSLVWIIIAVGALIFAMRSFDTSVDPDFFILTIGIISLLVLLAQPFVFALLLAVVSGIILAGVACAMLFLVFIALPSYNHHWIQARKQARFLYCPSCLHRSIVLDKDKLPFPVRWSGRKVFREKKIRHELFEDYFSCRRCSADNLLENVRTVVGIIGEDFTEIRQQGNRVYVNLWSESKGLGVDADFNILEIHARPEFPYDYVINSLINSLAGEVRKEAQALKQIPVFLMDGSLVPEESLRLLQKYFKVVVRERIDVSR